jgi:uncharacterized protein (TIGR01777 family)
MLLKLVLPGGSGFLGTALAQTFSREGWEVVILSRHPAPSVGAVRTAIWDGETLDAWADELDGADAVINLAGRSVACRHTPKNRQEILASRIDSVRVIEAAVARSRRPPGVLVQASAIGIYGDTGDRVCDEASPPGADFMADVVATWERTFFAGGTLGGPRRVALRSGFILGRSGGGLVPLAGLTRSFLGGAAGNGKQYLSWLHVDDFCSVCRWVIARPESEGVYNVTAPAPVPNADFMRQLRKVIGRPWSPPAPAWMVKFLARWVMRVEPSLALAGCRCLPRRLLSEGFVFRHPDLAPALRDLLKPV